MVINETGIFVPAIDSKKCNNCGICLKVCPGAGFDYVYFHNKINGRLPEDIVLGPCSNTYSGYSNDREITMLSQSGGFVAAFLSGGFKKKLFDGAIVTGCSKNDPFTPSTFIARNSSEILDACGSKYVPVPVNSIISDLSGLAGVFAFVGTSCQIQGMRKAEEFFPELKKKIAVYLGLHCLGVSNYHYYSQLLYKTRLKMDDVAYFRMRDKVGRGWPGDMRIRTKSGRIVDLPGEISRISPRSYFSNWRCHLCFDKSNEFSDISCGDCRIAGQYGEDKLKDAYYKHPGQSDIVIRTERGNALFSRIIKDENFVLKESDRAKLAGSARIAEKKLGLNVFFAFARLFKLGLPDYGIRFKMGSGKRALMDIILWPYSVFVVSHYYLCHELIRYPFFRMILKIMPHSFLGQMTEVRERFIYQVQHGHEVSLKLEVIDNR